MDEKIDRGEQEEISRIVKKVKAGEGRLEYHCNGKVYCNLRDLPIEDPRNVIVKFVPNDVDDSGSLG